MGGGGGYHDSIHLIQILVFLTDICMFKYVLNIDVSFDMVVIFLFCLYAWLRL